MDNLIIKDEEFLNYKDCLSSINESIESELSVLVDILSNVSTEIVKEGDFHTNLESFVTKLSEMKGELSYVLEVEDEMAKDYISQIDEIDKTVF